MGFRFQAEETRKREKFYFGEMRFQREESVAGFRNFEDKFVFWLYKRLKC